MNTLVINYQGMTYGGIETFIMELMTLSLKMDYRIIWITTLHAFSTCDYGDILKSDSVEKVFISRRYRRLSLFKLPNIYFNKDEQVTMLSFDPLSYVGVDRMRERVKCNAFTHILILPHYTGDIYYPERFFNNRYIYKYMYNTMSLFASDMVKNNALFAFSERQIKTYFENYQMEPIDDLNRYVVKSLSIGEELSINELKRKAKERREAFIIATCTRFDFPHKGYLIGLIEAFNRLYKKYENLQMIIIGYGEGKTIVESTIARCTESAKKRIMLLGALPMEQVIQVYQQSTMVIGVAGSVSMGAKSSVISVPARNYSYDCECYGYYSESYDKTLLTEKGLPIETIIEDVINMDDNEYVEQCKKDRMAFAKRKEVDSDFVYKIRNETSTSKFKGFALNKYRIVNLKGVLRFLFSHKSVTD